MRTNSHRKKSEPQYRATRGNNGTTIYLAREIARPGPGQIAEHTSRNSLDDRRQNLRLCTQHQNCFNRKPESNKGSQYKGVSWDKMKEKWKAACCLDGKIKTIGRFKNEIEAARAYDEFAKRTFGEYAYLNGV